MIPARDPATAWRVIGGEAVILSLETKVLRGLNAVGSRVWELIDGQRSVDEIVAIVAAEFDAPHATASADVHGFVEDLLAKGLVTAER